MNIKNISFETYIDYISKGYVIAYNNMYFIKIEDNMLQFCQNNSEWIDLGEASYLEFYYEEMQMYDYIELIDYGRYLAKKEIEEMFE